MMKIITHILIVTLFFVAKVVSAQEYNITATVVNVTSDQGKVSYALYDKENYMKQPIQAKKATIENGKSTVVFENVPLGEYAVICFHDKNENNKMDFEPSGMPMEDYGASNNVMRMGPPMYHDSKFLLTDKDVSLEIKF
ncbi:DUF2141 domain-containing protein [uncultured Tenacibaculum sp.]|uniref:DUF2141 domain-containing protein n=1 Tax=uncultured Tenacibaculum sp. TaxID=174713 RepID=UPI00261DF7EF|nr:DUF2141 domain-containing protein [uncultured Tenacibaculum sp.]